MLKFLAGLICSVLIGTTLAATPQPQKPNDTSLVEGKDYTILNVAVTKTPEPKDKINVKEFFSYTCIHCKEVEPLVEKSIVSNKNLDFNKIQVVWSDQAEIAGFAKLSATITELKLSKLNAPIFEAIFGNTNLNDPETLKKFLLKNGLTSKEIDNFMATYNSFAIAGKVGEYKNLTKGYNISGTPTFIIADKYVANPALPERLITVVNALINKAKQEATTTSKPTTKAKK
ncbi:MAG: disulfide bond formation protein DsbA [Burkholderiales bacterium]|jgi:thiol:disulfide interchange protein DsbA|nr:disulfide bond formation protein DsbA [Burkholderiales bacterium]